MTNITQNLLSSTAKKRFVTAVETLSLLAILVVPLAHTRQIFDYFLAPKAISLWLLGSFLLVLYAFVLLITNERLSFPFFFIFIYIAWLIPGYLFSILPQISFYGSRWDYTGLLTHLSVLGFFVGGYLLAKNEHLLMFIRVAVVLIIILAGIAWLQFFGWRYPVSFANFGSSVGSLIGNPTIFGVFLSVLYPFLLVYLSLAKNKNSRLLILILLLLLFGAVFYSQSSTALAAIILATIYAFLSRKFGFKSSLIVALVLLFVLALGIIIFGKYIDINTKYRQTTWLAAIKVVLARPLTGFGFDTMRYVISPFAQPNHKLQDEVLDDPHNLFLNRAATTGVIAALLLAFFIFYLLWSNSISHNQANANLTIALNSSIFAYLVGSLNTPENLVMLSFFWYVAGLKVGSLNQKPTTSPLRPSVKFTLLIAACALFTLAVLASARLFLAEYYHLKSTKSVSATEALALERKATLFLPYVDYYYGYFATKAVIMSQNVSLNFLPLIKIAAEKAILINPLETRNYESLGFYYLLKSNNSTLNQAVRYFQAALKRNPYNFDAVYGLSKTFFYLGKKQQGYFWFFWLQKYKGRDDRRAQELNCLAHSIKLTPQGTQKGCR